MPHVLETCSVRAKSSSYYCVQTGWKAGDISLSCISMDGVNSNPRAGSSLEFRGGFSENYSGTSNMSYFCHHPRMNHFTWVFQTLISETLKRYFGWNSLVGITHFPAFLIRGYRTCESLWLKVVVTSVHHYPDCNTVKIQGLVWPHTKGPFHDGYFS